MSALPIRETVIARLQELSDEEVAEVMDFIREVKTKHVQSNDVEDYDPLVGFISGPTDLAERTEEILSAEFGVRSSKVLDSE